MKHRFSLIRYSKYLSRILRHRPEEASLTLDSNGWAQVSEILHACGMKGFPRDLDSLLYVVENNDKKRFSLNDDQTKIRAVQGHSIPVDLGLSPLEPPGMLYHGTAERFKDSIRENGLLSRKRRFVHLSPDRNTAVSVGIRHGKPCIFRIDTRRMHADGYTFYCSENGVWLTEVVKPEYIYDEQGND